MRARLTDFFAPASGAWRPLASGIAGLLALLLLWQLTVDHVFSGNGTLPGPLAIFHQFFFVDTPAFYLNSASHTLYSAVQGWFWGNTLALMLAALVVVWPWTGRSILHLGAVTHCLPIVAIGPVLVIIFSGATPRIILSAMAVFFVTLIGANLGLRSADRTALDAIHSFGGTGWTKLAKVRCRAALPSLFAALRIAAASAILGSIVGEFFGAENGLGVILINSQQALNYPRTWAIALFCTCLAAIAYATVALLGHLITPWARDTQPNLSESSDQMVGRVHWAGLKLLISTLLSLAVVAVLWVLLLKAFHVSTFIGKTPVDVWHYLTDPDQGGDNRATLLAESMVSLRDAFLGIGFGTLAAVVVSALFQLIPFLRRTLMIPALAVQSMPLIALTPLIILLFGRNVLAIAVVGGMITFFPTLVNVTLALDRTPRYSTELMKALGASGFRTLAKVRIPFALPALFASMRIAAPAAMTGALLAEWLATGKGLGYALLSNLATSDYDGLWTRVAMTTLYSLLLYTAVGLVEKVVLKKISGRT